MIRPDLGTAEFADFRALFVLFGTGIAEFKLLVFFPALPWITGAVGIGVRVPIDSMLSTRGDAWFSEPL